MCLADAPAQLALSSRLLRRLGLGSPQAPERLMECHGQGVEMGGAAVGQGVFHLAPDSLVGVEFGRVGGKALQVQPGEAAAAGANRLALVRVAVVPDLDDVAAEMAQQVAQEPADLRSPCGVASFGDLGRSARWPPRAKAPCQRITELAWQCRRRATAWSEYPCWTRAMARSRRRSSSAGDPSGRIGVFPLLG